MKHKEYLYWHNHNGELQYYIGDTRGVITSCGHSGQDLHFCYSPHSLFSATWFTLDQHYWMLAILSEDQVPGDIRALHLLLHQGGAL